jgi:hypothetical protein
MNQWFRVFGLSDGQPAPGALTEELRRLHEDATAHFRGDDLGWFEARLFLQADMLPILVERFLTREDDIRSELSTWAGWIESTGESPTHLRIMQHIIATRQFFTLHHLLEEVDEPGDEPLDDKLCLDLCRFLARSTDGIYQVDHHGFFAAAGTLLLSEAPDRPG